jgi:hypothetical protein
VDYTNPSPEKERRWENAMKVLALSLENWKKSISLSVNAPLNDHDQNIAQWKASVDGT